jgi:D-Tyr-tRNAtyr deacylase
MPALPTLISLLDRLHAGSRLLTIASELLPLLDSKDSVETISSQIAALRNEIEEQIQSMERSMQNIEDRIETIAQFILLHRTKVDSTKAVEIEQLVAMVRGQFAQRAV